MKRTANPHLSPSGKLACSGSVFLFPSGKTKESLSERALGYIVKKYAVAAKLPDISLHDLRHCFGYRMAEAVPLHRLAQLMGHESLDTTMLYAQATKRIYNRTSSTLPGDERYC